MGFSIVGAPEQIETVWCTMTKGDQFYVGQIVCVNNEGIEPLDQASGVGDLAAHLTATGATGTANNIPFGIILGFNLRSPSFDTTYKAETATETVTTSATSDSYFGVEGPLRVPKDTMAEVAVIYPHTRIRGHIFNAAYGTATTVGTVSTGGTVSSTTTAASPVNTVANLSTIYFRTGACAGQYRILDSASTTTHTWDAATDGTVAVGDTAVAVNGLRTFGHSLMQLDSEATYIDSSAALTADYFFINVLKLDLSTAGSEYVEFNFSPQQLTPVRDDT